VWAFAPDPATPGWRRGLGGLALLLALGVSLGQLGQFQRLYRLGTAHLAEAARVLSAAPEGRVLFVNFPDRLGLRPQPYPLGYWGLTLAPVVQDLSGFARATSGQSGADRSLAVFQAGAAVREAWPYRVDLRGADTPPSEVWAAAQWAEAVYLSEYGAAGTLSLRPVGAVRPASAGPVPLALLGSGTELLAAEVVEAPGQPPRLALLWHTSAPQTVDTTIFVHLWRDGAFAGGADGDSLGGVLPPAAWQPEGAVHDLRPLPDLAPGAYRVSVGLYRRWDGQRLPAYTPDGQRLPEDEIFVATVTMP
jgi:hypothetical protein